MDGECGRSTRPQETTVGGDEPADRDDPVVTVARASADREGRGLASPDRRGLEGDRERDDGKCRRAGRGPGLLKVDDVLSQRERKIEWTGRECEMQRVDAERAG